MLDLRTFLETPARAIGPVGMNQNSRHLQDESVRRLEVRFGERVRQKPRARRFLNHLLEQNHFAIAATQVLLGRRQLAEFILDLVSLFISLRRAPVIDEKAAAGDAHDAYVAETQLP